MSIQLIPRSKMQVARCHSTLLAVIVVFSLISCQENPDKTTHVFHDTIINGRYINQDLNIAITLPKQWAPVPVSEIESWRRSGQQVISESTGFLEETRLFSYWDNVEAKPSYFTATIMSRSLMPKLSNQQSFAEYNGSLISKSFSKIGIQNTVKIVDTALNGKNFTLARVDTDSSTKYVLESYYSFTDKDILTLSIGYSSEIAHQSLLQSLASICWDCY